jgi:hypothetical protein
MAEKLNRIADKKAGVENLTAHQQPDFARSVRAQGPVNREDNREKKKEAKLDEKHGASGAL